MTLAEAIALYLAHLKAIGRRPKTIRLRDHQLSRFAREGAPRRVDAVRIGHVEAWIAGQVWAPNTARSHRVALRTFFQWCEKRGHVTANHLADLDLGPETEPRPTPVDDDAYRFALLVATARERLMLRLSAEAGLRRGEVALVHTQDLFEDLGGWSLVVHGKGGKLRYVPLKDDIARGLRACPTGWVFVGETDGHLSAGHVGVLVRRLLPRPYSMHKLRTRFGTRTYAATHDLVTVQRLMGHSSPKTTLAYIRIGDQTLRDAVNAA